MDMLMRHVSFLLGGKIWFVMSVCHESRHETGRGKWKYADSGSAPTPKIPLIFHIGANSSANRVNFVYAGHKSTITETDQFILSTHECRGYRYEHANLNSGSKVRSMEATLNSVCCIIVLKATIWSFFDGLNEIQSCDLWDRKPAPNAQIHLNTHCVKSEPHVQMTPNSKDHTIIFYRSNIYSAQTPTVCLHFYASLRLPRKQMFLFRTMKLKYRININVQRLEMRDNQQLLEILGEKSYKIQVIYVRDKTLIWSFK